jgi:WD40 repeat protein
VEQRHEESCRRRLYLRRQHARRLIDATNVPAASINEISKSYLNLCTTLSRTVAGGGAATAYDHFVNADDINALAGSVTYQAEGGSKAVVTNGDYVLNADTDNTIHVVIASGSVTVSGHYSGLILAGGDVTLQAGTVVTASRAAVTDALSSLLTEDGKAYRYLNPLVMSPMNVSTSQDGTSEIWDMNNLVTFANWKKNEI